MTGTTRPKIGRPTRSEGVALQSRILKAARAHFLEQGFGAASMEAIAECAQTSKVTIYKRFGDKRGLYDAVCREWASSLFTDEPIAVDPSLTLADSLRLHARSLIVNGTARDSRQFFDLISTEGMGPVDGFEIYSAWEHIVEQTATFLRARMQDGLIHLRDVDRAADIFCRMVLTYLHVPSLCRMPLPEWREVEPDIDRMIVMFLGGIAALELTAPTT